VDQLIESLRAVVGLNAVLAEPDELIVYECDGLTQHKHLPRAVVLPSTTEETSEVMRVLAAAGIPFTPRGAGTGLSGGALALERAVVIELARMRRILKIDKENHFAVVETGVVNSHVSRAASPLKLHYVPDPSSQPSCTIGGNIAENAGGVHCLKYGTTTDHVLGLRVVLAGGEIVDLGGVSEKPGYDVRGVFIGSEGTFGIATEATLRLVPVPPAVRTMLAEFAEVKDASHAVSAIIASGLIPAGLEMMDREVIRALEASVLATGLPQDLGAALLIELDGLDAGIDDDAERVKSICLKLGARKCRMARDENERKKLWAARKGAFGAIGRITADAMIQDAVVPRSRLPQIMSDAYQIAGKYQLRIANVFHAGDGNLHPLICFDSRSSDQVMRVKEAGRELMETCVRAGGSITGEHGVGLDKRELLPLIFSDNDMQAMLSVRAAFDPTGLMNPGKIIPLLRGCGEARAVVDPGASKSGQSGLTAPPSAAKNESNGAPRINKPTSAKAVTFDRDLASKSLSSIVGPSNVSLTALPWSKSEILTVAPSSIDEACEIMKLAGAKRWSVLPSGYGSWLDAGNPIGPVNLAVSTRRLNRIIEHEPADLVAVSEAGVSFPQFNEHLKLNRQRLPLDPPGCDSATIGGIVATGLSGPQRCGYGPPRGFVIGMKVVLADGRLIKAGGRVVKNVAGYDLCKLFTGSYGTLGLIVEINFKLRPCPEREVTVLASGSIEKLIKAAGAILQDPLFPVAVEIISPRQAEMIGIEVEDVEAVLLVRFAGNKTAVDKQSDTSLCLLAKEHISEACTVSEDSGLWQQLADSKPGVDNLVWRMAVPPSDLISALSLIRKGDADQFKSLAWQAGIANGVIRARTSEKSTEAQTQRLRAIRTECKQLGGSLIVENAPVEMKESLDVWGDMGSAGHLMKRIKQQLDPDNLFSPGRFGATNI
jgi:glycolate oxidase subunit GlcD